MRRDRRSALGSLIMTNGPGVSIARASARPGFPPGTRTILSERRSRFCNGCVTTCGGGPPGPPGCDWTDQEVRRFKGCSQNELAQILLLQDVLEPAMNVLAV